MSGEAIQAWRDRQTIRALQDERDAAVTERDEAKSALARHNKLWYERQDEMGLLKEQLYKVEDERDAAVEAIEKAEAMLDPRCGVIAPANARAVLRAALGVTEPKGKNE